MIKCSACSTPNSVDSKFCKHCGGALPDAAIEDAQRSLENLSAEGYKLFEQGRVEEAFEVAITVIGDDPENSTAWALKGMCLERRGKIADALEAYEEVVRLNPDSSLDRIKVTHLRKKLAAVAAGAPEQDRRRALGLAIAAAAFVIAVGSIAGALVVSNQQARAAADANKPDETLVAFNSNAGTPSNPQFQSPPQNQQVQQPQGTQTQPPVNNPAPRTGFPGGGLSGQIGASTVLPNVNLGGTSISPLRPDGIEEVTPPPTVQRSDRIDPDPVTFNPPTSQIANTTTTQEQTAPTGRRLNPTMEIRPTNPGTGASAGESSGTSRNQAAALRRTADELYLRHDYERAASTYQAALNAGADPARVNQRLGDCYQYLGRKQEALAAYERSERAILSQIERGDNSALLQTMLESVRQAIKVLRGG
ncbi:MAG: tetratricopeptide repeat protein [Fimbriimonadaceae bacterium]